MNQINKSIRILLIDDDEEDYIIVDRLLSKSEGNFRIDWCKGFDDALELIGKREHDIYLVDYRIDSHTGLDLMKKFEPQKRIEPFIILTGAGDEQIEHKAMHAGAADYLVKGSFDARMLTSTIRHSMQRKILEQERVQQLMEINIAKDEFISVASHQLRTPATGVKQYIGMVLEGYAGELSEAQREMLQKAYESNERQLTIVSNLLRVAQVDAGKVHLRKADVNLTQLLEDILKEQHSKFTQRNQTAVFKKTPKDIYVNIDKTVFRMVLENIIDNASKYSEENKTVTVILDHDSHCVRIKIKDEGVGIKPEDQDRLFEKFFRIDNPLSTLVGGTGLGLYWAKKIVDLHGGNIAVSSIENTGTTFTITLPQVDQ